VIQRSTSSSTSLRYNATTSASTRTRQLRGIVQAESARADAHVRVEEPKPISGGESCPCGSGRPLRTCHGDQVAVAGGGEAAVTAQLRGREGGTTNAIVPLW